MQAAPDIYQDALKSFDLRSDVTEESTEKKENDCTELLEKGEDGRYYDKSRGYDSIEAWEKEQRTSAKRYDSVAEYCKKKADKEWARFKNAEKNGESDAEKWKHYDRAREYYEKAGANKAKGEALWAISEMIKSLRIDFMLRDNKNKRKHRTFSYFLYLKLKNNSVLF